MQARAWWLTTVSGAILLASSCLLAAPPKSGASRSEIDAYMQSQKEAMENADADTASRIRIEIESGVEKNNTDFLIDYVGSAARAFEPLVSGSKKEPRLASVILLANLSQYSDTPDEVLGRALGVNDPAVRYWAARGFYYIIPKYISFSPTLRESALNKVRRALQNETDPLVKAEMWRTLANSRDQSADTGTLMLNSIKPTIESLKTQIPTISLLNSIADGMDAIKRYVDNGGAFSAGDRDVLLGLIAESVSFPVQRLMAVETKDPSLVTTDSLNGVFQLAQKAAILANTLAPNARLVLRSARPTDTAGWLKAFSLHVGEVFGSPSVPGQLQKAVPSVAQPAAIGQ